MKRFWILAGALAVTLTTLTIAMLLGSAGFKFRQYRMHESRLRKVMRQEQPTVERLTRGFRDEGTALVAAPADAAEAERVVAAHGSLKLAELRAKLRRYPQMRLYRAGDMLYFVFFDDAGVMKDFTCVAA